MILPSRLLLLSTLVAAAPLEGFGADWPMWRHDAARSAATPDALPGGLHEIWVRDLPPQQTAWPASQDKLQFDAFQTNVKGATYLDPQSDEAKPRVKAMSWGAAAIDPFLPEVYENAPSEWSDMAKRFGKKLKGWLSF